jgi:hypothetical protein
MRAWIVSIGAAALVVTILGGCADDAPSKAETTAIGRKALSQYGGFGATTSGQRCAGTQLVRRLGADGAEDVAARSDLTKLGPDQRDAVVAALDHCTSADGMVGLSATALGATSPTDPMVRCLSKRLNGKVGTLYLGMIEPKSNDLLVTSFDACVPPATLAKALATDIASADGAVDVEAVAACLAPKLDGRVGETFRRRMRASTPTAQALKDLVGPCVGNR